MLRRLFATRIGYTNNLTKFIYFKPYEVPTKGIYELVKVDTQFDDEIPRSSVFKPNVVGESEILVIADKVVVMNTINNSTTVKMYDGGFKGVGITATINKYDYAIVSGLILAMGGVMLIEN
jgi:hypothetical protein